MFWSVKLYKEKKDQQTKSQREIKTSILLCLIKDVWLVC